jgi:uncharacterized membrane protein YozB (DUF420 family)
MITVTERVSTFLNQERKQRLARRGTLITVLFVVALLCPKITIEMRMATIAYTFLVAGMLFRKERQWHGRFMATAVAIDLSLVLYLEFKRAAVEKVAALSISKLQAFHVGFSTGATLLYCPLVILGLMAFKHKLGLQGKSWHRVLGIIAFCFRTLGFIFMFAFLK